MFPIMVQLCDLVVIPALKALDLDCPAARVLVLGTAAHESNGCQFLRQVPQGPAFGFWQMEPPTEEDTYRRMAESWPEKWSFLNRQRAAAVDPILAPPLAVNLVYAAAMCRAKYWLVPEPLPAADDLAGMAGYWKRYWNTDAGDGTPAEFLDSFGCWIGSSRNIPGVMP